MHDDVRRFSTDAFPQPLRAAAWSEVLAQVLLDNLPDADLPAEPLDGYVSSRRSPLGSAVVRLAATPQVLAPAAGRAQHYGQAVLLFALLDGSGQVSEGDQRAALSPGHFVLLDPARPWRIALHTRFRALAVRFESASFLLRLVRTRAQALDVIAPAPGLGAACAAVLRSIADGLDHLAPPDLLAVEATLSDLLVNCVSQGSPPAAEDSTAVRLGHLRRVSRTLEARLADADLTIDAVARLEGLSTRYVQQLFKSGDTTFSEVLKERRLERCRADLVNRALDHVTIAELCFRWGFGDAANFSRAFTARYGRSPKAYRAQPPRESASGPGQRGRPVRSAMDDAARRDGAPPGKAAAGRPGGLAADVRGNPAAPAPAPAAVQSRPRTADGHGASPRGNAFQALLSDHARYAVALALTPKRATTTAPPSPDEGSRSAADGADHYYVPVSDKTIHWGYFSRALKPVISVRSGDVVTMETLTQHAGDDRERMIDGDPGAESVFHWTATHKAVDRRGAGPQDASIFGRGAGEGFGVHICTGPVYVKGAEPGDVLEVRILDILPRPSCHPAHHGRLFGSNAAAWWGFQYQDLLTEPKPREVVTVYEIEPDAEPPQARAVYNYRWTPQTDPFGVVHPTIDYPGVPVDPASVERRHGVLAKARIPVRPHFGVLAVAPKEHGLVDSIPPGYFGGNLDNWRAGKGASLFLPVSVPGALFSAGDPHASQGDSELCGTAIECSLTGVFQLVLHKRAELAPFLAELDFPFLETADAWVLQGFSLPNHLAELGPDAQAEIYKKSSLEGAMRDAFRKTRRYLMQAHGLDEDEAISLISVGVDFGVTQVVDGNWGVHAVLRKSILDATG